MELAHSILRFYRIFYYKFCYNDSHIRSTHLQMPQTQLNPQLRSALFTYGPKVLAHKQIIIKYSQPYYKFTKEQYEILTEYWCRLTKTPKWKKKRSQKMLITHPFNPCLKVEHILHIKFSSNKIIALVLWRGIAPFISPNILLLV